MISLNQVKYFFDNFIINNNYRLDSDLNFLLKQLI